MSHTQMCMTFFCDFITIFSTFFNSCLFILRIARVNGALNIMYKSSVVDVQYPIQ